MLGQCHLSHPRERSGLPRRPRDAAAIRALPGAAGTRDGADRWQRGARRSPPGAGPALAEGSATRLETHFLEAGGTTTHLLAFKKTRKKNRLTTPEAPTHATAPTHPALGNLGEQVTGKAPRRAHRHPA